MLWCSLPIELKYLIQVAIHVRPILVVGAGFAVAQRQPIGDITITNNSGFRYIPVRWPWL